MYNHMPMPQMLFPLTWVHFYSSTNSHLKENSCFLGHCSQKTNMLSKQTCFQNNYHKTVFLTLSQSASVPPKKYEKFQELLFLCSTSQSLWWPLACALLLSQIQDDICSYHGFQKQQAPPVPSKGAMLHTECRALIQRHNPLKLRCLFLAKLLELVNRNQGLVWVLGINSEGQPQCDPFSSIGPPFFLRMKFCSGDSRTQHILYLLFTKFSLVHMWLDAG